MFKLISIVSVALFATLSNALPPAGSYNIVNRVLSTSGQQLALTFGGENAPITLQPLMSNKNLNQIWTLTNWNSYTMTVTARADTSVQAAPSNINGASIIVSSPPGGATYNFFSNSTGLSIGGGAVVPDVFWYPESLSVGARIIFGNPPPAQQLTALWVLTANSN